jgi:uncharacterized protein YbjT (DUF2867 family)
MGLNFGCRHSHSVDRAALIVAAMHQSGMRRLIFVSSMGIYGEVPGERYRSILAPYRDSAAIVGASGLNYTVLRPGWFTRESEVNSRITRTGEPFVGHGVSIDSLSDPIAKLALDPSLHSGESIGVSRG